jgi:hypothetical protein
MWVIVEAHSNSVVVGYELRPHCEDINISGRQNPLLRWTQAKNSKRQKFNSVALSRTGCLKKISDDNWLFCLDSNQIHLEWKVIEPTPQTTPPTFSPHGATAPSGPGRPHFRGFTITLRHTTLGRTPLDEWSARRKDLYLTTHDTHKRETSMPPVEFEPAIPASDWPQTHALDRAATGIGENYIIFLVIFY